MKRWQTFMGLPKWDKLHVACSRIGYDLTDAHRAMADTKAARAVLLHMASYQEAVQESLIEAVTPGVLSDHERGIV